MSFAAAGIPLPPEVYEPPDVLRRRFAKGEYIDRANRGEFVCCLINRRATKQVGDLVGMASYMVGYVNVATGVRTFVVHFFMDADGTIGASGLPDPKWLCEDGVVYTCNRRGAPDHSG